MTDIKDRIIDSATKCFVRYGYNKTTLEDIGKNVGLKKNSLYHYFKNKEEIFLVVLKKELGKITSEYLSKIKSISGYKNKIIDYFTMKLKTCEEQSILHSILTEIWDPNHPLFNQIYILLYQNEIDFIKSILTEAFNNGEVIEYNFNKLAESLSLVFGLFKQQAMNNSLSINENNSVSLKDNDIIFTIETLLKAIEKKSSFM